MNSKVLCKYSVLETLVLVSFFEHVCVNDASFHTP